MKWLLLCFLYISFSLLSCSGKQPNKIVFHGSSSDSIVITDCKNIICDSVSRRIYIKSITDLRGSVAIIPKGYKLVFDGGFFRNGTLIGNDTEIEYIDKCFDNIIIEGTWHIPNISSDMFFYSGKVNEIVNLMSLTNPFIENTVIIEKGVYNVRVDNNDEDCIVVPSNTTLILKGIIMLLPNSFSNYNILRISGDNILIKGGGSIIGDKNFHIGNEGQWGMGIFIYGGKRVTIEDICVKDCWGDCIYIGGESGDIFINNCNLDNGRRQGISITSAYNVSIFDCIISNIKGHAPESGIDIEPNEGQSVNNVNIKGVSIFNCIGGILCYGYEKNAIVGDISIDYCNILGCVKIPVRLYGCNNVDVLSCWIETNSKGESISKEQINSYRERDIRLFK